MDIKNILRDFVKEMYQIELFNEDESALVFGDCLDCRQRLICKEFGLNFSTALFYFNKLKEIYKEKQDFCLGKGRRQGESPSERLLNFCMDKVVLTAMFDLFEIAEKVNRTMAKAWDKILDKQSVPLEKLHEEAVKETNKMTHEIKEGLTRLINVDEKENIIELIRPEISSGIPVLTLHGDELRQLVKNKQYYKLTQKPKIVFLGHYHRLFAFERGDVVIVFTGTFMKTHPCYEYILMPSLGFVANSVDKSTGEFHIDIHRM